MECKKNKLIKKTAHGGQRTAGWALSSPVFLPRSLLQASWASSFQVTVSASQAAVGAPGSQMCHHGIQLLKRVFQGWNSGHHAWIAGVYPLVRQVQPMTHRPYVVR